MSRIKSIRKYYKTRIYITSEDHEILGWETKEAQLRRFSVLTDAFELTGKSLLDVGCGLCSLLKYLNSLGIKTDYTGTDIMTEMVEIAKKRYPGTKIYLTDVFNENHGISGIYDIVFSSGIFNINLGNNRNFLPFAVNRLLSFAKKAVVFNLLHMRSSDKDNRYFYYQPDDVRSILKTVPGETFSIEILDNYLPNDFTVICRKQIKTGRKTGPLN